MLEFTYRNNNDKNISVFFINKAFKEVLNVFNKIGHICSFNTRFWLRKIKNSDKLNSIKEIANSNIKSNTIVNKAIYENTAKNNSINIERLKEEFYNLDKTNSELNTENFNDLKHNIYNLYQKESILNSILFGIISTKIKDNKVERKKNNIRAMYNIR